MVQTQGDSKFSTSYFSVLSRSLNASCGLVDKAHQQLQQIFQITLWALSRSTTNKHLGVEVDLYWHFWSSINAQEETEGIQGIRIREYKFSPLHYAYYNTKRARYKRAQLS